MAFLVSSQRPLKILRLLLAVEETSAPYNQFSLPRMYQHDITICTYFRSRIPSPAGIRLFEGDGSLAGFFRNLRTALAAGKYHVVHVHSPHLGALFLLATLFSHPKLLAKTVYTVHSSYANFKLRNRLLMVPVFAAFRRIVCCGEAASQSLPRFFRWLAGKRLCSIRNGVDLARVDRVIRNRPVPSENKEFVVVAVGRLIQVKNPLAILDAFKQGDDSRQKLFFVGEGPLEDRLLGRANGLGLQARVTVTGLISRERVYEHLGNADVFISVSKVEGIPVAVLEAMASCCPVILSDIPAHREIAGGAAFIPLIPPDDIVSFARAIESMRQLPRSDRKKIGAQCRRIVEERFSLLSMHQKYQEIYEQLVDASEIGLQPHRA